MKATSATKALSLQRGIKIARVRSSDSAKGIKQELRKQPHAQ
ncbi:MULTISPECIES: hypothetical protein [Bradyrhizobium]|nr:MULTISPECIES: hypothetical protein [Bradyrhizobium]SFU28860.1 hypothetical protein SAMN05192541_10173 [Bradyrhizobium arachidis]